MGAQASDGETGRDDARLRLGRGTWILDEEVDRALQRIDQVGAEQPLGEGINRAEPALCRQAQSSLFGGVNECAVSSLGSSSTPCWPCSGS